MSSSNMTNVVAVVPVKDHPAATGWYAKLFGREADVVPMDEVAEWQLASNAWVQVAADAEHAGGTTVVIGVEDIQLQRSLCTKADVPLGEVVEYPGVIKMAEAVDPDGNKVVFVQDISGAV